MKRRNRARQTTTLEERLAKFSAALQEQAKRVSPHTHESQQLQKRISSCNEARRLNGSLNARR